MPPLRGCLLAAVVAIALGRGAAPEPDASCPAGDGACTPPGGAHQYYWSHQKGDVNRTGLSPHVAPRVLSAKPTWSWVDPHLDVISQSPLIDDRMNIYINTRSGRVYKFSPDGAMLWEFRTAQGSICTVPAIMDGSLYANTKTGYIFSLDMESGQLRWEVKVAEDSGGDSACLLAVNGTVIAGTRGHDQGGNLDVVAVDSDGRLKWTYKLEPFKSFNFQASSPGDGSVLFMDSAGGVYRLDLETGRPLWESGIADRKKGWFTTGAAVVGPNGLVYAASNDAAERGILHAYRLSDGSQVWRRDIEFMANQAVAVGPIAGSGGRLAAVAGVGQNPGIPLVSQLIFLTPFQAFACLIVRCILSKVRRRARRIAVMAVPVLGFVVFAYTVDLSPGTDVIRAITVNAAKFTLLLLLYLELLLRVQWWHRPPRKMCRRLALAAVFLVGAVTLLLAVHYLSLWCKGSPQWLWHSKELPSRLIAVDAETGETLWVYSPPVFQRLSCAGDEELYLQRLWRRKFVDPLGDEICLPDSWSQAVIGADGTVYVGFMDGHLYIVRDEDGNGKIEGDEARSVDFTNAFQGTQAIAPGMLVVVPCGGGMHVWKS